MAEVKIIKADKKEAVRIRKGADRILRVAAYCRVSTDSDEQLDSYNSQVAYYTQLIEEHSEWEMAGIYADAAITVTKVDDRTGFKNMIEDAKAGRIDYILTKSISRFARNTMDVLKYVRLLQEHHVTIRFEEEKLDTSTMDGELMLSVLSAVYQQEVENTSANVKKGLRMKMMRGQMVGFSGCLGYDYDPETKSLSINEKEAEIVRFIFKQYLDGIGCVRIVRMLEERGYRTKAGDAHWSESGVRGILKNEKYKGDLLMGKTYTISTMSKRRTKNFGEEDKFLIHDHHEPIISAEDFEKAQNIRTNRSKQMKGIRTTGEHVRLTAKHELSCMMECGFCGKTVCRRVWPGAEGKPKRVRWQCLSIIKEGKKYCPKSKAITEEAIKGAFVASFNKCIEKNLGMAKEAVRRFTDVVKDKKSAKDIQRIQRKIRTLNSKVKVLMNDRLDGRVSDELFDSTYKELYNQINDAKAELEKVKLEAKSEFDQFERMNYITLSLTGEKLLKEFDSTVFHSIVEKVTIGGYEEDGTPDPDLIRFIYKTKVTDDKQGDEYKPKRKRRNKKQLEEDLKKNQAAEHSVDSEKDGLILQPPVDDIEITSASSMWRR